MVAEADIVRLNVHGDVMAQQVQWGLSFGKNGIGTDIDDLASDFQTNIIPLLVAATSAAVTWNTISVDYVLKEAPEGLEVAITGTPVGSLGGDALPPFCAAMIAVKTGLKGRRRRGRCYIPGLTEPGSAIGYLQSIQLTALQALGAALTARYAVGGAFAAQWLEHVYSPADPDFTDKHGVHTRLTPLWTSVTNHVLSEQIRHQVSRSIGRGI